MASRGEPIDWRELAGCDPPDGLEEARAIHFVGTLGDWHAMGATHNHIVEYVQAMERGATIAAKELAEERTQPGG